MQDRTRNIVVGMTVLFGLAGLAVLLFLFGKVPEWIRPSYIIHIQFDHAGGLNSVSRVKYNGIDVGRVVELTLLEAPQRGVIAQAKIDNGIAIPRESNVSIKAPLLGGSPTLTIDTNELTDEQMSDILPTDGSAKMNGANTPSLATMGSKIESAIDKSVTALRGDLKRALDSFDGIRDDFHNLSEQWVSVGKGVNELVEPRDLAEVDAGEKKPNVHTVLARADQRLNELKTAITSLNEFLGDEQLRSDLRSAAAGAKDVAKSLDDAAKSAKKMTDSVQGNADQLTKRLFAVADDLSKTLMATRKAIETAEKGDGTMGKLLNDPSLFNNLNDAVQRISAAADEVKLLIEKWKVEGVPVKF